MRKGSAAVRFILKHPCQFVVRLACAFILFSTLDIIILNHYRSNNINDFHEFVSKDDTDRSLALYTFWLTVFTGLLAISTIGLWVTTRTGMRDQSLDMKRSLRLSTQSNEMSVKVQNPYLNIGRMDSMSYFNEFDYFEMLGVQPNIKNCGSTAAINVKAFIADQDFSTNEDVIFNKRQYHFDEHYVTIGANGEFASLVKIKRERLEKQCRGECVVAVAFIYEYNDVFSTGIVHRSACAFKIEMLCKPSKITRTWPNPNQPFVARPITFRED